MDAALARGKYLIAADMGTGKTICAIAVAEDLLGCGDISLCLVVCPPKLKYQWARALAQFTDLPRHVIRLRGQPVTVPREPYTVLIDGKARQAGGVRSTAAQDRARQYASVTDGTQYVILSYESILDDSRQVRRLARRAGLVVLDECTEIKTFKAQRAKKIKKLLTSEYRLGLTGTPIENGRPEELFSIMQWVDEDVLGRWDLFDATYIERNPDTGVAEGYRNLGVLHERLAPAMARLSRRDPGVAEHMPGTQMDDWPVPLEGPARDAYMAMGRDLHGELKNLGFGGRKFSVAGFYSGQADESTRVGRIAAVHTAMEQLLDHPDLVVASAMAHEKSRGGPVPSGSAYCYRIWQDGLLDDVWDSGKLPRLQAELGSLLAGGAKVLIFSKYRQMLNLIQDCIAVPCVQYHGQMTSAAKEAAVAEFSGPAGPPVFLSSHAGAYGVDMNTADHLVNFDSTVIAGRADQINARHVRASSEFATVYVHNLYTAGTIEVRNLAQQDRKRRVATAIMDGRGARAGRVGNDVASLTRFLEETIEGL